MLLFGDKGGRSEGLRHGTWTQGPWQGEMITDRQGNEDATMTSGGNGGMHEHV